MRKRYLESTPGAEADEGQDEEEFAFQSEAPEISRTSLEDDARKASLHGADPAARFWLHQRGWTESAQVGAGIIQAQPVRGSVKKQQ